MRALVDDLRFATRTLLRQRGYTVVAVLTLALGISANTAIFSVLDAIVVQDLPYRDADRLVRVEWRRRSALVTRTRQSGFEPLQELAEGPSFAGATAVVAGGLNLGGDSGTRVRAAAVSRDFFATLGSEPIVGRTFSATDTGETKRLVVISEQLWRSRFSSDRDVAGRSLVLNGRPFVVMGVLPRRVQFPDAPDVWIPAGADGQLGGEVAEYILVVRLKDAVGLADARAQMVRLHTAQGEPPEYVGDIRVTSLRDALTGAVRPVLYLITACAVLVLLVSCLNIANLLLIRVALREREFAVQHALGAPRWRLARHVLLESLVLSIIAGAVAAPIATWMLVGASRLLPANLHGASDVAVDARAFSTIALVSLLTALLSGALPSISIDARALPHMVRGTRSTASRPLRARWRSLLVTAQIAVALVLLAGALTLSGKWPT